MGYRFRADGVSGQVAIYENSDDAPWSDPLNNKARVVFHSNLVYPARISTFTGTIVLPARSNPSAPPGFETYTHTLAAHGQAGIPMVEGRYPGMGDAGADLPACGSVPVQRPGISGPGPGGTGTSNWRWLTLGADATNVLLYEGVAPIFSGFSTLPSITINYEIHILDKLFTP